MQNHVPPVRLCSNKLKSLYLKHFHHPLSSNLALLELAWVMDRDLSLICDAYRLCGSGCGPDSLIPCRLRGRFSTLCCVTRSALPGLSKDVICVAYQGLGPAGRDARFETGKGMSQWLGVGVARKGSRTDPLALLGQSSGPKSDPLVWGGAGSED